jgi:hypothetical protein
MKRTLVSGLPNAADHPGEFKPITEANGRVHMVFSDGKRWCVKGYVAMPGALSAIPAASDVVLYGKYLVVEPAVGSRTMQPIELQTFDNSNWRYAAQQRMFSGQGNLANPLATLTGVTAGVIYTAGTIPANLQAVADSYMGWSAMLRKSGANATCTYAMQIGGQTVDSIVCDIADDSEVWLFGYMHTRAASTQVAVGQGLPNAKSAAKFQTLTLTLTSAQAITFAVSGANAGDTHELIEMLVWGM